MYMYVVLTITSLFLPAKNSVTKEKDFSRFYRHLLHQQTSPLPSEVARTPTSEQNSKEEDRGREKAVVDDHERTTEERETREAEEIIERLGDTSPLRDIEGAQRGDDHSRPLEPATESTPTVVKEDPEEKRKRASAKRTNEESLMSARERYLARKRAKVSVTTEEDS